MSEPKDAEWEQLTLPGFEPSEEPLMVSEAELAACYEKFRQAVATQIVELLAQKKGEKGEKGE